MSAGLVARSSDVRMRRILGTSCGVRPLASPRRWKRRNPRCLMCRITHAAYLAVGSVTTRNTTRSLQQSSTLLCSNAAAEGWCSAMRSTPRLCRDMRDGIPLTSGRSAGLGMGLLSSAAHRSGSGRRPGSCRLPIPRDAPARTGPKSRSSCPEPVQVDPRTARWRPPRLRSAASLARTSSGGVRSIAGSRAISHWGRSRGSGLGLGRQAGLGGGPGGVIQEGWGAPLFLRHLLLKGVETGSGPSPLSPPSGRGDQTLPLPQGEGWGEGSTTSPGRPVRLR